ncbi:related to amino acid permease [Fusarium fujikuroi IMI 58289]|uniref:Related to amino acid permease n=1 Tax=Gibberella fujikuroi (strain CBS 195.34 / IMI 58289 / NRRL A-6831) TaxID=1279085 RepID=S0DZE1_GIBF5|nr:related to amino acid permease [Fusarium fujikuroi IMI 58289]CCT66767.1 related to amino acid permease [Fusarium fujikuroi IMI 58289]
MANVETGQQGENSMSPDGASGLGVPFATSHGTNLNGNATTGQGMTDALPDTMESRNETINRPPHQTAVDTSEDEPDPRRQVSCLSRISHAHIPQMITINGTLGAGLYVRSGQILELAGPIAVIIPFLVLCVLAWWVMSCITELLCLWPVPGALPLFVAKFVDPELGNVVAIAYWFTYSIGFAALVSICASTIGYWLPDMAVAGHVTCYCLLPFILGGVNSLEIGIYGLIEAVTGTIKLIMLIVVIIILVVIDCKTKMTDKLKAEWEQPTVYDEAAATSFAPAFIMAFPIATFAFTGVEIIAASIVEARWKKAPKDVRRRNTGAQGWGGHENATITTTIRSMAAVVPIIIGIAYVLGGALVAIGLSRSDPALPRLSWVENGTSTATSTIDSTSTATGTSNNDSIKSISSPFTLIAIHSDIDYLEHVFNAFILFTALTCANTNLYVASRVLFGVTSNIRASRGLLKFLSQFSETYTNGVPLLAVWVSIFFCWVPFLEIPGGFDTGSPFGWAVGILTQSGSSGCVNVGHISATMTSQSRTSIHISDGRANCVIFYSLDTYKVLLQTKSLHPVRNNIYPYRSYGQPILAWIFAFLFVWLCLKLLNGKLPWITKLTKGQVVEAFDHLKTLRDGSLVIPNGSNTGA